MTNIAVVATELSIAGASASLAWAAVSDIMRYIIPNRVIGLILSTYAISAFFISSAAVYDGFIVGLSVFSIGSILFALGLMGGGDVKLLAAVAPWAGSAHILAFMLVTSVCGAVLGVFMLSPARRLMPTPPDGAMRLAGASRGPMPFGAAIAVGGVFVLALQLRVLG